MHECYAYVLKHTGDTHAVDDVDFFRSVASLINGLSSSTHETHETCDNFPWSPILLSIFLCQKPPHCLYSGGGPFPCQGLKTKLFLGFPWAKIHLLQHLWPFVPSAGASPKTTWTRSRHKWSMVVRTFCWKVRLSDLVGMAMNTMCSLLGAPGVWRGVFFA